MRPYSLALCSSLAAIAAADHALLFVKHVKGASEVLLGELNRRSDPTSDDYLSWLTREEVQSILRPDETCLEGIREAVSQHSDMGAIVLQTGASDKIIIDFGEGKPVPTSFLDSVAPHIDVSSVSSHKPGPTNATHGGFSLKNGDSLTAARRARRAARTASGDMAANQDNDKEGGPQDCLSDVMGVTPICIRNAYGIVGGAKDKTRGQAVIVNQGFKPSDISAFQTKYNLPQQKVVKTVGTNPGTAGDEASLDLEYIMSTGQGTPTTYVWLDGHAENPFANWLTWASGTSDSDMPKVHSLSLGAPENEVGDDIMKRMNTEMAALGLRGVTIVFASGDSGYQPQQKFGAASPYVTSVGGIFSGEMRNEELQVDEISTGGFAASPLNKAQKWQAKAIASFMATTGQRPANIDTSQRAVPDVSAYDDEIAIVQNGGETDLSGTSAACPMVAGMLSTINDALAAAGHKTTLGFANPFLYANEGAFLDITKGNNMGIAAVPGYDPASGLGTFSPTTLQQLTAAALKAATRSSDARAARGE